MSEEQAGDLGDGAASTDGEVPDDGGVPPELVDAVEEHPEEVARLISNLDQVNELLDATAVATSAMDDEMIMTLAGTGSRLGEVVDTAADEEVAAGLESVLHSVGDATDGEPEPVGVVGLVRAMRDPEVRAGLGVAIALLRALGTNVGASDS
jgi:uncharacterized protein YjgD (DUF1641 family)